ncbi:glycosyltransferase family 4 protein [Serratia rubidaea]|uniref:glycosyltransferase family 4 protein n=1 Tax=Serratia rubidaea TaxID=61652 RepID=UPI002431A421|nr:glycosyltransferase family 4 protein [Serratia rubidaea]MCR0999107.1 glycosyltransferase family 4 protein [Serratia rubidaea]
MNILIINTLYTPFKVGGAEVSVQLLAEELAASGNKVRVVCLHDKSQREKKVINDVEVVYLPLKNVYWPFDDSKKGKVKKILWHLFDSYNPLMAAAVEHELDDFKPDVVHTNNVSGFSVAVWDVVKRKKIRLVHTTRDYYLFHHNCTLFKNGENMDVSSRKIRILSAIKRWRSKNIDAFVGISDYIAELHRNNGYAKNAKYTHIYNPINSHVIDSAPAEQVRVGFIGRLTADKGFADFCHMAKKTQQHRDITYFAAGRLPGNDEGKAMQRLAEEAGVTLVGFVPADDFLASVDMLLLPTRWNEPFGRVVAEGASAGKHVFASFTGGIKEIADFYSNVYELNEFTPERVRALKNQPPGLPESNPFDVMTLASSYQNIYQK